MSNLHEECGVFGIYAENEGCDRALADTCYYGLFALQHRGQESCGIVVNDKGSIRAYTDVGLVEQVFTPGRLRYLGEGDMAVGHCRYGTTGSTDRANSQPIVINHIKGTLVLAHNGNLSNSDKLREELELGGAIFHTTTDTEVISYIITAERLRSDSIEEALAKAMDRLEGAYSLVMMAKDKLIAVRDPHGFHPICFGKREDGAYVVASESCALEAVGAEYERELEPGEILVFENGGLRSIKDHCGKVKKSSCIFEFIYFARPDSVIDGSSVHNARARAGSMLALTHPVHADVVIGVPDSGLDAAIGYARQSGIPYGIGFIKNKYIGRTFISPGQKSREDKVRIKLNPIASVVSGKRVVLIDDSIVRGTTMAKIVKLLRDAGATEVHVRVSAPHFLYPCFYGTDIDSSEHLIAYKYSVSTICDMIGADSLGYLRLEDVREIAEFANPEEFCTACFDGNYPTETPIDRAKNRYEINR